MKIKEIDQCLKDLVGHGKIEILLSAVFTHSCYGFYQDQLITILPKEKALLPRSVTILGSWTENSFEVGQVLRLGTGFYHELRLTKETRVLDLTMQGKNTKDMAEKSQQIHDGLITSKTFSQGIGKVYHLAKGKANKSNGDEMMKNSMEMEIGKRIKEIIQALTLEKEITAENILGYGVGLTPSADDFLLGILSVLEKHGQSKRRQVLADYILKHYEGTTEVSRYMLHYGIKDGTYPKFLVDFLTKPKEEEESFQGFLAHGSTSGTDLLTGILVGMEILLDVEGEKSNL